MAQVDRINGLVGTLGVKAPVRVATTANITLSGLQTLDGVALVAGDRVLVKDQTAGAENGIYAASASAWAREPDFDGVRDVVQGTMCIVYEGTANANTGWAVATANPIVIGTSSLSFTPAVFGGVASAIANTPAGNIAATTVQAAIDELDTEKAALAGSASQAFSASTLNGAPIKHHNDIRNGSFRVAQRGTSFAAPAHAVYDLDGWQNINTSAAVYTNAQATGSSTGKLCRTTTVTTADASVAAGDVAAHVANIEGYNAVKYLGNTFTIGFNVKSAVTGIHCIVINDGTSSYVIEYSIGSANTWEYKTITVTGGLQAVNSSTNAWGARIRWCSMCGTTYQTTAGSWNAGDFYGTSNQVNDLATNGNVFALEDITMNLGTVAAVDEMSYEDELRRCQRYYERTGIVLLTAVADQYQSGFWAVEKRASPTLTLTPAAGTGGSIASFPEAPTKAFFQTVVHSLNATTLVTGACDL